VKIDNLHQEHDAEAPYADTIVLDSGGLDARYGGETLAHISFEGLDAFEIAFHAMPDDWEPYEEWDELNNCYVQLSVEQHCENGVYAMLNELGKLRGWTRA